MTGRELNGKEGFLRVLLRFLTLVVLPGALLIGVLWTTTDAVSEGARDRGLETTARASLTLLEADLARATARLTELAAPWPEAAQDDPAVRMAAEGDTVRALRHRTDGIGVSILIPASAATPDSSTGTVDVQVATVARADGRLRSVVIERLGALTGLESSFYMDREWLAGDSTAPATLVGDWIANADASDGAGATLDLGDRTAARLLPALGGSSASTALLVVDDHSAPRPVSRAARILVGVLFLFAAGVTVLGLGPGREGRSAPWMTAGGLTLFVMTMVGSLGWAVMQTLDVEREASVRDLSRVGALLRAYDRVDDAVLAERLSGHRVVRISTDGAVATSDGSPVPTGAATLPATPPNFPATGRFAGSNELYMVLRGDEGRTVLLRPDRASPLPAIEASLGGLLLLLAVWFFVRGGLASPDPSRESDEVEEDPAAVSS